MKYYRKNRRSPFSQPQSHYWLWRSRHRLTLSKWDGEDYIRLVYTMSSRLTPLSRTTLNSLWMKRIIQMSASFSRYTKVLHVKKHFFFNIRILWFSDICKELPFTYQHKARNMELSEHNLTLRRTNSVLSWVRSYLTYKNNHPRTSLGFFLSFFLVFWLQMWASSFRYTETVYGNFLFLISALYCALTFAKSFSLHISRRLGTCYYLKHTWTLIKTNSVVSWVRSYITSKNKHSKTLLSFFLFLLFSGSKWALGFPGTRKRCTGKNTYLF